MKTIFILFCIFVFTAADHAEMERKVVETLNEHIKVCAEELQMESMDIGKFSVTELEGEERTKIGCLKACVMKRLKVLEDGAIKVENFQDTLETIFADKPELIATKMELMSKCVDEVKEKADECDLAFEWARCTMINDME